MMKGETADMYIDVGRQVYVPAGHAAVLRARVVQEIERCVVLFPPHLDAEQNERRNGLLHSVRHNADALVATSRIALAHYRQGEMTLYARSVEEIAERERVMRGAWARFLENTPASPLREDVGLISV